MSTSNAEQGFGFNENPLDYEGKVLNNIEFTAVENQKTGEIVYKSSDGPDSKKRKMLKLDPKSEFMPEEGRFYSVKVIEDSKPGFPLEGFLTVRIIPSGNNLQKEQWKEADEKVDLAEPFIRQVRKFKQELYSGTKLTEQTRAELTDEAIAKKSGYPRRHIRRLSQEPIGFQGLADDLLGPEGSPQREMVSFRFANLRKALSYEAKLQKQRQELLDEESQMLARIKGAPSGAQMKTLDEIRAELKNLDEEHETLVESSPEAYYGLHLRDLKEYHAQLESGGMVETPYVKKQIEELLAFFNGGSPVLIHGHLGSGKTELAMHTAKKYIGKEALVISGSKHTSLAELYGHQILSLGKIDQSESGGLEQGIEQRFSDWSNKNPDATEEDKDRAHERILQTQIAQVKSGTVSDYFLGPIYRAMEEGRPVIIDEVNAIPHEVLISLNHILTREPGDVVNVQQDSGKTITIQKGFGIIMTGNLNQGQDRYVDRQDLDPAFLSRLQRIDYDYLPQSTSGRANEADKEDELYHLILARAMDEHGNLSIPEEDLSKLWELAKAARIFQNIFAGREIDSNYYFQVAGSRPTPYYLQETVLSLRALDKIISQWQKSGAKYELDYYLWKSFVGQATSLPDKAFLYQQLQGRFNFFNTKGWPKDLDYGQAGKITSFNVTPPENLRGENKFYSARDTVKAAFGDAPERKDFPEYIKNQKDSLLDFNKNLDDRFGDLEELMRRMNESI